MARIVSLYVDFQSRLCLRAWKWLRAAELHDHVSVRPYSQDTDEAAGAHEPTSPWDRQTPAWGVELLALGELARETGPDNHVRYVDAAFALVHESDQDPSSVEAILALAAAAGVDLGAFSDDSERWRAEVGLWHAEAEDELGVRSVPALLFNTGAVVGFELDQAVTDPEAARRLVADIEGLVTLPVRRIVRTA